MLYVIRIIQQYKSVSGLELNLKKTYGRFFNKTNAIKIEHLPLSIENWNKNMMILGIPYGDSKFVAEVWKDIVNEIRRSLTLYNETSHTYDAKAIITKSLVLPKISYIATTLDIPLNIRKQVDNLILNFVTKGVTSYVTLFDLAQKRWYGGYNIDHTSVHANVFCLLPIFKYVKNLLTGEPLSDEEHFIDLNIGRQLAKVLGVPVNNSRPHKLTPSVRYANILNFITSMKISKENLMKGKIKLIYESIICSKTNTNYIVPKWRRVHSPILPNYLKTFNYKVCYDLLPFKTKFVEFQLDTDSRCNFCNLHPDTHPHVFARCQVLIDIWKFLDKILEFMKFKYSFVKRREMYDYCLVGTIPKGEELPVIYLNSLVNYKIWNVSRKIQNEKCIFDLKTFKTSIMKSLRARKSVENNDRVKHCQKIDCIEELCQAAMLAITALGAVT